MTPNSNFAMFNDLGVYGVPKKVRDKERYEYFLLISLACEYLIDVRET